MINAKIIDQDTTGVPGGFCCKNPVDQYMTGAKNPTVLIVDQDTTGVPKIPSDSIFRMPMESLVT